MCTKIENEFGKKIGGSRRDLWNPTGIDMNDLMSMNDDEKEAYIKKDNVWPKPDYNQMRNNGSDIEAVYFIKLVRDSVAVKPVLSRRDDAKELYITAVSKLRDKALLVTKKDDISSFSEEILGDPFFVSERRWRYVTPTEALSNINAAKVVNSVQTSVSKIQREIEKKRFLYSDDQKALASMNAEVIQVTGDPEQFQMPYSGDNKGCMVKTGLGSCYYNGLTVEQARQIPAGRWVLRVRPYEYVGHFESKQAALDAALALGQAVAAATSASSSAKPKKKTFCYQTLENLTQSGQETVQNVTGEDYINDFGFWGGEFGNWLNGEERQKNLDMGYVSFANLAKALGFSDKKDVSLGGRLSIAFGARGKGNALAHFEPLKKVINLTKLRGAGSLAHEYGHSIDFMMASKFGLTGTSFMEDSDKRFGIHLDQIPEAEKLIKAMKYTDTGRTEFYEDSCSMDGCYAKQGGYWSSMVEMFARAFACYIKDELASMGIRDDYLCGHADAVIGEGPDGRKICAFPRGEERKNINAAIKDFLKAVFA